MTNPERNAENSSSMDNGESIEPDDKKQEETDTQEEIFLSRHDYAKLSSAPKLMLSPFPWYFFIAFQASEIWNAWKGKISKESLLSLHSISLFLAAISIFLMFNFGKAMSLKEDSNFFKSLSFHYFSMCSISVVLFLFANVIPIENLLGYHNIFRNLIIMTGSKQGMQGVWLGTCAVLAIMGFKLWSKSRTKPWEADQQE